MNYIIHPKNIRKEGTRAGTAELLSAKSYFKSETVKKHSYIQTTSVQQEHSVTLDMHASNTEPPNHVKHILDLKAETDSHSDSWRHLDPTFHYAKIIQREQAETLATQ